MLDEATHINARLYSLHAPAFEQLVPQYAKATAYADEAERNLNPSHYVSFFDLLHLLLRQYMSLPGTQQAQFPMLLCTGDEVEVDHSLHFSVHESDGVGLENLYWLSLQPGQGLNWRLLPSQQVEQNPQLLLPLLLAVLLAYDWFGPLHVRFMGGNVPKASWYQAMYLYLDLLGLKACPEPRTNSRQGQLVRMLPELYDDCSWQEQLFPAAAATNLINPPLPGSVERRDRLAMSAGFASLSEPSEPLVWQSAYWQRVQQLTTPLLTPTQVLSSVQQHFSVFMSASQTPVANVDGLKHQRFDDVLNLIKNQRISILVKMMAGVGASHLLRQVAVALVSATRLADMGWVVLEKEIEHAYRNGGIVVLQALSLHLVRRLLNKVSMLPLSDPARGTFAAEGHADFRLVFEVDINEYELLQKHLPLELSIATLFIGYDHELFGGLVAQAFPKTKLREAMFDYIGSLPDEMNESLHLPYTLGLIQTARPENLAMGLRMVADQVGASSTKLKNAIAKVETLQGKSAEPAAPSKAQVAQAAEQASAEQKQQHLVDLADKAQAVPPPAPAVTLPLVTTTTSAGSFGF